MELRLERLVEAGVTVNQFMLLALIEANLIPECVERDFDDLLKLQEELFLKILDNRVVLRAKGQRLLAVKDSTIKSDDLLSLSKELMDLFPKGNKPGTNYRWKGTLANVAVKVKKFVSKYPQYTREEIINATRNYVDSFKYEDTRYMQLLIYFIEKNEISKLAEAIESMRDGSVVEQRVRETSI
jgi:hypothetical protein